MILGLVMYLLVEDTGNIHAQCLDIMVKDGEQHCRFNSTRQIIICMKFECFLHFDSGKYVLLNKARRHECTSEQSSPA